MKLLEKFWSNLPNVMLAAAPIPLLFTLSQFLLFPPIQRNSFYVLHPHKSNTHENSLYLCQFPFSLLFPSLLYSFFSFYLMSNISRTKLQEIKLENSGNEFFSLDLGCYFVSLGAGQRSKDRKKTGGRSSQYEEARMKYHRHRKGNKKKIGIFLVLAVLGSIDQIGKSSPNLTMLVRRTTQHNHLCPCFWGPIERR